MQQRYYPPIAGQRLWLLTDALPGRRFLLALWGWM